MGRNGKLERKISKKFVGESLTIVGVGVRVVVGRVILTASGSRAEQRRNPLARIEPSRLQQLYGEFDANWVSRAVYST